MGTSLASVQVHIDNNASEETRLGIIDALRQYVLQGSFTETIQDSDPDRSIFVGPINANRPWLTLLDTQGNLRELTKFLSEVIKSTTVFISLFDSDVIHLRCYRHGLIVDDYCNDPEMYDSYTSDPNWLSDWNELNHDQLKALQKGDISKWQDLFVEGANVAELHNIWNSDPVFADDILWATVKALGMNEQEIWSEGQDETFTRLTFRLKEPRQYEIKGAGLPRLDLHSYGILTDIYHGDDIDISIAIRNDGGMSTGLNVVAWGSALDRRLISLAQVKLHIGTDAENMVEGNFIFQRGNPANHDLPLYAASLADFEIPAGISGGLNSQNQPGIDWWKAFNALNQTLVHVRALGKVEAEGQGDLFMAFVPHQNRRDGHVVYRALLSAHPAPRHPLRYQDAGQPVPTILLDNLQKPVHFFVLISLNAEREQSANIVGEIIEDWIKEKTKKSKDSFVTHLRKRVDLLPDEKKFSVRQILNGAQWKTIRRALETCVSFSIAHNSMTVIYDVDPLFFQSSNELLTPQLAFFLPLENLPMEEPTRWEEWSTKTVNHLMERKLITQAFMGRWNWQGQQINMTPYETVTGIGGQCTTAQFWCKRFLRGVTKQMWLGPDLITHLGGIDHLVSIAEIKKLSDGVCIHLDKKATLDDLENALEPLLPGKKDWLEGMKRLYSGRDSV